MGDPLSKSKMVLVYLPTWLGDFLRANVGVHIPAPWVAWLKHGVSHHLPSLICCLYHHVLNWNHSLCCWFFVLNDATSQLTGRRVDGSSSPVTRRVFFFWKMLKNGWPDSIQVIECYWAFAWYHKSELLTCIYNHIYVIEFKSSDLIWYMAFVLIELIERYFSIFFGC